MHQLGICEALNVLPCLTMETTKQNFKTQRDKFGSLLFLLALGTGVASCGGGGGGGPEPLTLVQVECDVLSYGDILPGGPEEGPYTKVLTKYWSDGTTTTEREKTTYKQSCP